MRSMLRVVPKEESQIRLSETGDWYHHEAPFEHPKIIAFFHRAIRKDENGQYYLHNQYDDVEENVYFEVDDTAYFVADLVLDDVRGVFVIRLNTDDEEVLDLQSLKEDERGVLYCTVLDGDSARFSRPALEQLAEYATVEDDIIYIDRAGERVNISGVRGSDCDELGS